MMVSEQVSPTRNETENSRSNKIHPSKSKFTSEKAHAPWCSVTISSPGPFSSSGMSSVRRPESELYMRDGDRDGVEPEARSPPLLVLAGFSSRPNIGSQCNSFGSRKGRYVTCRGLRYPFSGLDLTQRSGLTKYCLSPCPRRSMGLQIVRLPFECRGLEEVGGRSLQLELQHDSSPSRTWKRG
jgi:hypothetical protein